QIILIIPLGKILSSILLRQKQKVNQQQNIDNKQNPPDDADFFLCLISHNLSSILAMNNGTHASRTFCRLHRQESTSCGPSVAAHPDLRQLIQNCRSPSA